MPVSDQVARCTVRIECADGPRRSVGSSFLFRIDIEPGTWIPLLITNRHVTLGYSEATVTVTVAPDIRVASPSHRRSVTYPNLQAFVTYHPDPTVDLAALFLGPVAHALGGTDGPINLTQIQERDLVDPETERQMRFVEDVLVVGYPQGLWDSHRNLPIFRSGITASPAMIDYQNESKFLIDCSIFPGSSGSPVFLYNSGVVFDGAQNSVNFGERLKLLGVVSAVMLYHANGDVIERAAPTAVDQMAVIGMPNNLGVVVKARELLPLAAEVRTRFSTLSAKEQQENRERD